MGTNIETDLTNGVIALEKVIEKLENDIEEYDDLIDAAKAKRLMAGDRLREARVAQVSLEDLLARGF